MKSVAIFIGLVFSVTPVLLAVQPSLRRRLKTLSTGNITTEKR